MGKESKLNTYKKRILDAGYIAIDELIKVSIEPIIADSEEDLAADRLKNAAATKKLAVFDALEILQRLEDEKNKNETSGDKSEDDDDYTRGFAERRSK